MKAISFASSIVLAGALFVSAGAQAQESPYQFWQEDKTSPPVEDLYSQAATFTNEVADPVRLDDLADREEAAHGGARSPGQLLTDQNNALFSLLGTTYGGDGRTTFSLPDLRGRVANSDPQVPTPYGNEVPEAGAGDEQPYGWLRGNDEYAEGGRDPIREAEFPSIYELDEFRYPTACPRPVMCVPDPPTIHELPAPTQLSKLTDDELFEQEFKRKYYPRVGEAFESAIRAER